ncbi:glycosyltransferase [Shewanella sp. MSW]|uniref:glycosyltransferase n=1 Tax=Shewanella sp. MSW TaxID=2569536 RepID=UPI0011860127|nr:glycosyltransferase [Shewanella sp. MSW]TVP09761.1 hypothetical protein AYI96_14945 [Shewanella sp. MSW]
MAKKTVIICIPNAFKFGWLGSTTRLFSITNAFLNLGYEVVVISQAYESETIQKEIETVYPARIFRTDATVNYPKLIGKSLFIRKMVRKLWRLRGQSFSLRKISLGWSSNISLDNVINNDFFHEHDVKLIWGISGGMLDGPNLASRLANKKKVPWVFELHDPPFGADLLDEDPYIKVKYGDLLRKANIIIPTSDTYSRVISNKYSIACSKIFPIFLTYDDQSVTQEYCNCHSENFWCIGYAGSLNGKRTLRTFIEGLACAIEREPAIAKKVKLKLAGTGEGFDEIINLAVKYNLSNIIEFKGLISGGEADELLTQCNALLIVQPSNSNLEIPGKLFKMLSLKKPIIALMDENSETSNIIDKSNLGYITSIDNVEKIKDIVIELYNKHRNHEEVAANVDYIESFSQSNLVRKVALVCSKIVD